MQSTTNLAALGGITILSLGLISCNGKDNSAATTPWGLSEPEIISVDGVSTKYTEINTLTSRTYSVDDRLVLKVATTEISGGKLKFRTSCIRGEERSQYADQMNLKLEYSLLEFMPQDFLYSVRGVALAGAHCSIEITAIHASGARQNFPTMNLLMNDQSQNNLELFYNLQPLARNKLTTINIDKLNAVTFAQPTDSETLKLQCETAGGSSDRILLPNLAALNVQLNDDDGENSEKAQYCRVFKMVGQNVKAVSPFFILSFFDHRTVMSALDNSPLTAPGDSAETLKFLSLARQKLHNPSNQNVYLLVPKSVAAQVTVKTTVATSTVLSHLNVALKEGRKVNETATSYTIELKPLEHALIEFTLGARLSCREYIAIVSVAVDLPNARVPVQAITADGSMIVAEWNLMTEKFKVYQRQLNPVSIGDNSHVIPNQCQVY